MKMSMNKYMHPRNPYKHPPNFKQLAIQYAEFRTFVKQDISGKVTLDFKDVNALRSLSRVLLLKDFDLNVEIPPNKLIPTIPLRLNYLLWIEDLLNIQKIRSEEVWGIDIGTGASCVYPLIAAKKFKWNMLGTEIDEESIKCARKNVSQNLLDKYIEVYQITQDTLLIEVLNNTSKTFKFCMCNPPFFSSKQELHPFFKSRRSNRPHPKNAFCASVGEVVVNGGEVEFITKLIKESKELKYKIDIFTTMIGHKSSLNQLKALLREVEVCSFKQTEFCQGRTTRWGLAWTYLDIDLRKIPEIQKNSKTKPKAPLSYIIPNSNNESYRTENINIIIRKILQDLKVEIIEEKINKGNIVYDIKAYSNTWSNQRRKKREKLNQLQHSIPSQINGGNEKSDDCSQIVEHIDSRNSSLKSNEDVEVSDLSSSDKNSDLQDTSEKLSEMDIASNTPKREHEDDDDDEEYYDNKKFKGESSVNNNNYIAQFFISLKKVNVQIIMEIFSIDSNTNRETLHQILQYFKNNIK
ncbi:hypothetical protein HHI36_007849 [Cryptolaemus montrouzieri]|uniref:U6 small nuclear RNA (adenine-(43)-N(6))-methyltransferase n=1 Tax=Cryptolaemus montrouzieri TaxID=559131 RepID=A0ABD2MRB9_9CUCU